MTTKPMSNKEKQRLRAERAAAALREKQRRERRRQILTVVGIVARHRAHRRRPASSSTRMRDDTKDDGSRRSRRPAAQYGLTIGPPSAPHKVVVYEDFLCPFCGEFEKASHEQLAQLADEGKVQVEYRPFVFLNEVGPYSARATLIWWLVREKSGDEVAKKFHDLLFANQPSEQGPFPSRDDLYRARRPGRGQRRRDQGGGGERRGRRGGGRRHQGRRRTWVSTARPTVILDGEPFPDGATVDDLAANLVDAVQ